MTDTGSTAPIDIDETAPLSPAVLLARQTLCGVPVLLDDAPALVSGPPQNPYAVLRVMADGGGYEITWSDARALVASPSRAYWT